MNLQPRIQSNIEPIRYYVENALSENTRKAYRNDLAHYRAWGGQIPATPETVASYLTDHAEALSIATLQRRLVSIGMAHTTQGYSDPTKADLVRLTFRGVRKLHGKPQRQVAPVLKEDLIVMLGHAPDTIKGIRDRALLLLGFVLRSEEANLVHSGAKTWRSPVREW